MPGVNLRWGEATTVDAHGVDLHVESVGDPSHPTVVALHGFASGTFTWAGIAPDLAADHRIVAYDRPPFGRSARPAPRPGASDPYGLEAQLDQLAAVVAATVPSGEPDLLVGHSAGGLLALQAVLAGVVRPRRLVLLAPAVDGRPPEAVRRLAALPGAGAVGPRMLRVGLAGSTSLLRFAGRHRTPLLEATAVEAGRLLRTPGTAAALWHLTTMWEPPAIADRLGEVAIPSVVAGGDEDRIVEPRTQARTAAALGADHVVFAGVGHAPQEQVPERVAALIRDGGGAQGRW